jgi:hypothetical protein
MNAGRAAPRYKQLALLYSDSKPLQAHFCEYLTVIVKICHQILRFSKKSYIGRLISVMSDEDIRRYQTELELWATTIKEEITPLMGPTIEDVAVEDSRSQAISNTFGEATAQKELGMECLSADMHDDSYFLVEVLRDECCPDGYEGWFESRELTLPPNPQR